MKLKGKLDAPEREGFVRRWVREDEMDHMLDTNWARVQTTDKDRFKNSLGDPVGNGGSPGKLFLVESPMEDAKKYAFEYQGGRLTQLQNQAISGSKNFDNKEKGGEKVSVSEGLPPQARIRRPER